MVTAWIIVILVLILLPVSLIAWHYFTRSAELNRLLDRANERRREITNFLMRFSTGLQGDEGVAGAMHAAARHVSEQTDAEAVAIYELADDELRAVGVCAEKGIPILGVNLGKVGFLTEVDCKDVAQAAKKLISGDYFTEKRKIR